jgi:hypothetical protein
MTAKEKLENEEFLLESIEYLKKKGFENIRADVEGFDKPKSYHKKGSEISITPDIVAERAGIKHYFDISLKSGQPTLLKSKWRFLEVLTRMKNHRFKIITRKGHYKFTNEMLADLNLSKNMIKI